MDYKIMIIEDDTSISSLLKEHIQKYNFTCKIIDDFEKERHILVDPEKLVYLKRANPVTP
jgi:DNA-binding response OmpR family regulator